MSSKYVCPKCKKDFASKQSVWNHKQRCRIKMNEESSYPKRIKLDSDQQAQDSAESENRFDMEDSIPKNEIKECHTVDDDDPLTESEQKELFKRFKSLHYDLIHKGLRKNATELLDILDILLETDLISEADCMKASNKINEDYLTTTYCNL